jgi:S1-C subfamily serine protease
MPVEGGVPEMARQMTVRILTNPGAGSGVIVERQGQIYTVLTNHHVVDHSQNSRYTVLTEDGREYPGKLLSDEHFVNLDVALVQFSSEKSYRVSQMGDSQALSVGDLVYAAGFPNWKLINSGAVENTRDWGLKAFRLTAGQVEMLSERALSGGYRLGYTNDIENGMSGGPILDKNGRLIGINGRLKNPLQGIKVFVFTDGTQPSPELFERMKSLSWGIPLVGCAVQNIYNCYVRPELVDW